MKILNRDLSTTQAAKLCGLSVGTIKKCFDTGRIKGYRVPRSQVRRIPRKALLQFMQEHGILWNGEVR